MADRLAHGLLDTSVVIDLSVVDPDLLPRSVAICAVTLAELAVANGLAVVTRNDADFIGLEGLVDVVPV